MTIMVYVYCPLSVVTSRLDLGERTWPKSSEFGERNRTFPNSGPTEPGFGPSFLWTPNLPGVGVRKKERAFLRTPKLPNHGSAQSFLWTQNLPNQGSDRSLLQTTNLSNQGSALSFLRTPNLPKPGLYPALSPNFEPAELGLTRSNSELWTETLNSGQKCNPGLSWILHTCLHSYLVEPIDLTFWFES